MPVPLLIPIALGAVSLLTAGGAGVDGTRRLRGARQSNDLAGYRQDRCLDLSHRHSEWLQARANAFQEQQDASLAAVLEFAEWLLLNGRKVRLLDSDLLDSIEIPRAVLCASPTELAELRRLGPAAFLGAAAGIAGRQLSLAGVATLASAGTGTAISTLSGAAAANATLAWLGGGTLAAGGAGMAGGAVVLAGVAAAPVLLGVAGTYWGASRKMEKNAEKFARDVDDLIDDQHKQRKVMAAVRRRLDELTTVLINLRARTIAHLKDLHSVDFDPKNDHHVALFQQAALLVRSLREVLGAVILDEEGHLTEVSLRLAVKYRSSADRHQ